MSDPMKTTVSIGNQMIDIYNPKQEVEVILRGNTLWVNVDGVCRLRVKPIPKKLLNINYNPSDWV